MTVIVGYVPYMITLKADDRRQVQIPGIKAGQVFAFEDQGNGVRIRTEVRKAVKEPFPRGSLLKYMTPERDSEMEAIAKSTLIGAPKDYNAE